MNDIKLTKDTFEKLLPLAEKYKIDVVKLTLGLAAIKSLETISSRIIDNKIPIRCSLKNINICIN